MPGIDIRFVAIPDREGTNSKERRDMLNFVAIDFETANGHKNSACSLAAVVVENGEIVKSSYSLIKPPYMIFEDDNIAIHGIKPTDVENSPRFDEVWTDMYEPCIKNRLVIAHNAKFDIGVLKASLDHYKIAWPEELYTCTVKISRRVWPNLVNHKLNTLGAFLGVEFKHHDALDDSLTCAKVAIAAAKEMNCDSMEALLGRIGLEKEAFGESDTESIHTPAGDQTSLF